MPVDPAVFSQRDPAFIAAFAEFSRIYELYHRAEVRGVDRIPDGKALYVGNHSAALNTPDTWILLAAVYRAKGIDAIPYGLAHDAVMRFPGLGQWLARMGAVPADPENALALFARGSKILVYPGGDVDSNRPFRQRNKIVFGGRTGYVRLALRGAVPIVPAVAAGAHATFVVIDDLRWLARLLHSDRWMRLKVWPLIWSLPWGLTLGPPPVYFPMPSFILIEVLEPIRFERSGEEAARDDAYVAACAKTVESRMQEALDRLAAERKERGCWT